MDIYIQKFDKKKSNLIYAEMNGKGTTVVGMLNNLEGNGEDVRLHLLITNIEERGWAHLYWRMHPVVEAY